MTDQTKTAAVHVRTIRVEIASVGSDELEVTGTLVDERPGANPAWFGAPPPRVIHDMRLTLRVRHPDLAITGVRSEMASHPYTICPEALPPLQQLVGLSIARGFTREVNERFGRQRGCAHFTALIHAMAPAVRQGAGVAFPDLERPAEGGPWFVNTCHAWRESGPLHRLVEAGDEAGLRGLSAFPRPPEGATARERSAAGRPGRARSGRRRGRAPRAGAAGRSRRGSGGRRSGRS